MKKNEILTEVIKEFLKITDTNKNNAEKAVKSYIDFYEFVEDHDDLKDSIYGFFYRLLDDYITFRFYNRPVPALEDSEQYMAEYKQNILNQANTFFNFGGIAGATV